MVDSNNQNFHHHTFGLLRSRSLTPVSDFRPLPGAHPVPVPEPSLLLQFFRANITVTCRTYGCHVSPHRFECLQPPTNLLPFDPFGPYHSTYHLTCHYLTCHSTWHLISSAPTIQPANMQKIAFFALLASLIGKPLNIPFKRGVLFVFIHVFIVIFNTNLLRRW